VTLLIALGIGLLGGIGAVARFLLDGVMAERWGASFPLGTFAVNMSGTLLLGLVAGASTNDEVLRLVATGLLGSYTTFSTWMLESQRLAEDGEFRLALVNFGASLAGGIGLAWIGLQMGGQL